MELGLSKRPPDPAWLLLIFRNYFMENRLALISKTRLLFFWEYLLKYFACIKHPIFHQLLDNFFLDLKSHISINCSQLLWYFLAIDTTSSQDMSHNHFKFTAVAQLQDIKDENFSTIVHLDNGGNWRVKYVSSFSSFLIKPYFIVKLFFIVNHSDVLRSNKDDIFKSEAKISHIKIFFLIFRQKHFFKDFDLSWSKIIIIK